MKPTPLLLALWLLPLQGVMPDEAVQAAEAEMRRRPREAFLIARQAAAGLAEQPALVQRLFTEAARQQEAHLSLLEEPQVVDLADYYGTRLGDHAAAARVQRRWLTVRRQSLPPGKAGERLRLAQLAWKWLKDRELAAGLCLEALRDNPELAAAARMLRDELGYHHTDEGWLPQQMSAGTDTIRTGMTAGEVRRFRGVPDRIARQHVNRRYLEQWVYDLPAPFRVEFQGVKGQELRVVQVHAVSK
jgi:hypothetical protein